MIENIRKYTGLMIVVLVLLFVGLVFLDGGSISRALGGKPVMQVGDVPISQKDFRRQTALIQLANIIPGGHPLPRDTRIIASQYLGNDAIENNQLTAGSIIMEMSRFLQVGYPYGPTSDDHFITNRLSIQKAGLEYGVTPGEAEVESFVENVLFADPEGNYDQVVYSEFLKNGVSNIGGNRGFNDYIRDLLTAQNLAKLIGGGITPEMETTRLLYDSEKQVITGKQIDLERAPFEGKVKPTEEELKAYFEENRENYKSDELRKVSYVLIEPDWEATLKTVTEEKAKAAEARAAKEAAEKKKLEEEKKKAEALAEEANKNKKPDDKVEPEKPAPNTPEGETPADETTPAPTEPDTTTEPTPDPIQETPAEDGSQGDPGETGEAAPAPQTEPATEPTPKPVPNTPTEPVKKPTLPLVKPKIPGLPGGDLNFNDLIEEGKNPILPEIPKTPKQQLNSLEKSNAVEALSSKVSDFYEKGVVHNRGVDFVKAAEEMGLEVKTTEFFSKDNPPVIFTARIEDNSSFKTVAEDIFTLPTSGDLDELTSETLQTEHGWIITRFEDVTDAAPLTFEEARTKVSIDLKKKMALEAMIKEAGELREKLTAAIAEGKSFDDAAKELKLETKDIKNLGEGQLISFGNRSQKMPNPPEFDAAKRTNPGEIAPVEFTPSEEEATRALIIYVDKREIVKSDKYREELDRAFRQQARYTQLIAFENWLNDRYNESDVVPPKTEEQ